MPGCRAEERDVQGTVARLYMPKAWGHSHATVPDHSWKSTAAIKGSKTPQRFFFFLVILQKRS